MPDPAPRTTVVSVCYNSTAVLPTMLASVPKGTPIVLVDNASSDAAALALMVEQTGARLIRNEENRGFGVACNQGAAAAETEFVLFLNPDASLETDALPALEAAMDRYPTAVALNPRITDGKGRPYFKHRSVLLPRHAHMPRGWPEADREVTVLSGAALMVRRADFDAVGGFDPAIFLYHEDDDLSLRLRATRGSLMFIREAAVRHQEGRSTVRSAETAAFKAWHMGRSRVYAMQKHQRPMARARAIASAVLQLLSPVAWLSHRRFAKQRAFLRGVLSA